MKVLVLDGTENHALACVRSLARAGHEVYAGSPYAWCKAGWSRYCLGTFAYPSPNADPEGFIAAIAHQLQRLGGALILPMTDAATLQLSAQRKQLTPLGGRFVFPAHSTLLQVADKSQMTRLAQQLGLATPRSVLIDDPAKAGAIAACLPYPVVIKPHTSEAVAADGKLRRTGGPVYARNPKEFTVAMDSIRWRADCVQVQEFVEGAGAGFFALVREGKIVAEFAHRRVRDVVPTGSGSALRMSVHPEPRLKEAGLAMIDALNWHGVVMIEFRVRRDGCPVFIEVNGRFWNSLPLAICAGVDFPAMLVQVAEGAAVGSMPIYQAGVRCRWLLGDTLHLVRVMAGPPRGYPGPFPTRLQTLIDFLVPVPGTYHDNFTADDPLPELGDWLHFLLHYLPQGIRKVRDARRARRSESTGQRSTAAPIAGTRTDELLRRRA